MRCRTSSGWRVMSADTRTVAPSMLSQSSSALANRSTNVMALTARSPDPAAGAPRRTPRRRRTGRSQGLVGIAGGMARASATASRNTPANRCLEGSAHAVRASLRRDASTRANSAMARSGREKCMTAKLPTTASDEASANGSSCASRDGTQAPVSVSGARIIAAATSMPTTDAPGRRLGRPPARPRGHVQDSRAGTDRGSGEERLDHPTGDDAENRSRRRPSPPAAASKASEASRSTGGPTASRTTSRSARRGARCPT